MIISTPAKIILSGEHSVCYGAPAIGTPLSLFLYSRWSVREDSARIALRYRDEDITIAPAWGALPEKLSVFRSRYACFVQGNGAVGDVLPQPHDLVTLTFAMFHERFAPRLSGLSLAIDTEIPVSSGLGSSSALILNILRSLLTLSGADMAAPDMLAFARDIENFQHGYSSGLDLALVSARHPLVFEMDKGVTGALPPVAAGLVLVHSGKPAVSTGQCVAAVRARHAQDTALWADFAHCTATIRAALVSGKAADLRAGVRENQKLLERIGVVPDKVKGFVDSCAAAGIPAKICGAGAVSGDGAGMVWVLADNDDTMQALQGITGEYGFRHGLYSAAG